jgi:hypothetical protein
MRGAQPHVGELLVDPDELPLSGLPPACPPDALDGVFGAGPQQLEPVQPYAREFLLGGGSGAGGVVTGEFASEVCLLQGEPGIF